MGRQPCNSTNYTVSVDVMVESHASSPELSGVYSELCGRINKPFGHDGSVQGYCLMRNETSKTWAFLSDGDVLKSGKLVRDGDWHTLSLKMVGSMVTASMDSKVLATVSDAIFPRPPNTRFGMMALATGWHQAYFDNFKVATLSELEATV